MEGLPDEALHTKCSKQDGSKASGLGGPCDGFAGEGFPRRGIVSCSGVGALRLGQVSEGIASRRVVQLAIRGHRPPMHDRHIHQ